MKKLLYSTDNGKYYIDQCENFIQHSELKGKIQLILTSPPFPLNKKKKYGNFCGEEYKEWFVNLAPMFENLLTDTGSIVIEMGNSWESGRPVQSLLHLKSLMEFVENPDANLRLCQEFICYNPARLPSPAEWVTIKKIRAIDSFTHIWWMAKNDYPKANNQKILRPYSKSMQKLLSTGKYNSGTRPSEHKISEQSFLKENKGSISHNVLELSSINGEELRLPFSMLSIANTKSNDFYTRTCKERNFIPHPARMPLELASFFIDFLTDEGDLVFDPFGGSNTTGFCAEKTNRKWVVVEANEEYGKQSMIRFEDPLIKANLKKYVE